MPTEPATSHRRWLRAILTVIGLAALGAVAYVAAGDGDVLPADMFSGAEQTSPLAERGVKTIGTPLILDRSGCISPDGGPWRCFDAEGREVKPRADLPPRRVSRESKT